MRGPPPDATVLRILVPGDSGRSWVEALPQVPDGYTVTFTLTAVELLRDLPELEARGYVFAGVQLDCPLPPDVAALDLLVPTDLAVDVPAWWEGAARCADRAFPLVLGPVLRLFSDLIELHQAVPERAVT